MGKITEKALVEILSGIRDGCLLSKCALIGGETAEMPGFYEENEFDAAGFAVGIVDKNQIIDGRKIYPSDQLLGIASSGLHSNGYSLIRKICFEVLKMDVDDYIKDFGRSLGEELLEPTRIYFDFFKKLFL